MGRGSRLLAAWRAAVERTAPAGTRRRAAYHRLTHRLTRLLRDHVGRRRPAGDTAGTGEAAPEPLPLELSDQPEVSIVVPVHGRWALTAACLRSLATDGSTVPREVIVVDDASPDDTPEHLERWPGVRLVRLAENQGYLRAVNAGIEQSRGTYTVLLNNDTVLRPGWLEAMLAAADDHVGVVGAKLVHPEGWVQEAGGIIWRDASGYHFGHRLDPDDPRLGFRRDVDYCSAACALVRTSFLREVGGFDRRFEPAYYEDTDLCFTARARGLRVVYQPEAVVEHLEGASHGTDTASGIKRFQAVNQGKFREKWREVLDHHPEPTSRVRAAAWRRPAGRALLLVREVPDPGGDGGGGGGRHPLGLAQALDGLGFGVTMAVDDPAVASPTVSPLVLRRIRAAGVEVVTGAAELEAYLDEVGEDVRVVVLTTALGGLLRLARLRAAAPRARMVLAVPTGRTAGVVTGVGAGAGHGAGALADQVEERAGRALHGFVDAEWPDGPLLGRPLAEALEELDLETQADPAVSEGSRAPSSSRIAPRRPRTTSGA